MSMIIDGIDGIVEKEFELPELTIPLGSTGKDFVLTSDYYSRLRNPFRDKSPLRCYTVEKRGLVRDFKDIRLNGILMFLIGGRPYLKAGGGRNFFEISEESFDFETPMPTHPMKLRGEKNIPLFVSKRPNKSDKQSRIYQVISPTEIREWIESALDVLYIGENQLLIREDTNVVRNLITGEQKRLPVRYDFEYIQFIGDFGNQQFAVTSCERVINYTTEEVVFDYSRRKEIKKGIFTLDGKLTMLSGTDEIIQPLADDPNPKKLPVMVYYLIIKKPGNQRQKVYQKTMPCSSGGLNHGVLPNFEVESDRVEAEVVYGVSNEGILDMSTGQLHEFNGQMPLVHVANGVILGQRKNMFENLETGANLFTLDPKKFPDPRPYCFKGTKLYFQAKESKTIFNHHSLDLSRLL